MKLIDVHTHVVPDSFPANPAPATNARWPCLCRHGDEHGVIEIAGKAFRELDSRSWSATRRLDDMSRDGISAQALSPMPELLSYWFDPADGLDMARHMNHVIAEMVAFAPASFHGLGMVPLQDPALAAKELARLQRDGFAGVEIGSNINGTVLGDPMFDEFYAEAERQDLALFVHALHPIGAERLSSTPDLIPFAAFPLDTGLAATTLIRAGVPQRYPNLRIGFSHGGGALPPLVHRLGQGWRLSDGFAGTVAQSPAATAARFFYDSLVYEPGYLDYLAVEFAPAQVFAGTDYPYAIQQEDLDGFLRCANPAARESLFNGAASRFLGLAD